ncbi:hypothetical protein PLESTF_000810800 [Pleodorina starrii]|nr:hypothetical protein PLESTF_000810800 [Pleodorina starrii]
MNAAAGCVKSASSDSSTSTDSGGQSDGRRPAAAGTGTADDGDAATDPAAAASKNTAAKRARADELLSRLNKKLCTTTDAKKRLALQAKMLRLLPKCSQPEPEPKPKPPPENPAATTASAAGGGGGTALLSGHSDRPGTSFAFKLLRTPTAALPTAPGLTGPEEDARRRLRQNRFGDAAAAAQEGQQARVAADGAEGADGPNRRKDDVALVESGGYGTSEALEKEYLRLTSLPRASDVRPPVVLAAALKQVKAKWLQRPDYAAASEQLKAIRQDLTVQHVRDALTVDVYETHGRLAIESDDLAEFRRCHGVLRQLYREGLPGNPAEFEAYGLLYTQATAAARNTLAMELSQVPPPLLEHSFVRHAMDVCAAARSGNYARFMALYDGAPRMSPYIMDRLLGQMRRLALQSTVTAYKPLPVPLSHLAAQLGLETEEEAAALTEQYGAVVDRERGCLDTRASAAQPLGPPRAATGQ